MHVVIVGAGIIGTLSAYYLGREGIKVTVLDRHNDVAQEASGANASQLSFSSLYPVASPSRLKDAFQSLFGFSPDIKLKSKSDPYFWRWGLSFLYYCQPHIWHRYSEKLLSLAALSRESYAEIISEHSLSFSYKNNGRLRIYSTKKSFDDAIKKHERDKKLCGINYKILTKTECLKNNPILNYRKGEIEAGLLCSGSAVGDTLAFCRELRRTMAENKMDVTFKTGINIESFEKEDKDNIKFLKTDNGEEISADSYVFCTGADTPIILRNLGYDINLYPIKGHTIAVPYKAPYERNQIQNNIVDIERSVSIAPLDKTIRFSSGMIFDRHNKAEDFNAVMKLKRYINDIVPDIDLSKSKIHTGLRPALPSSIPVAKRMGKKSNIFINTGHGMWGWTLAPVTCKKMTPLIKQVS